MLVDRLLVLLVSQLTPLIPVNRDVKLREPLLENVLVFLHLYDVPLDLGHTRRRRLRYLFCVFCVVMAWVEQLAGCLPEVALKLDHV